MAHMGNGQLQNRMHSKSRHSCLVTELPLHLIGHEHFLVTEDSTFTHWAAVPLDLQSKKLFNNSLGLF